MTREPQPTDPTVDRSLACVELVALATAYLEGAVPEELRDRIEGHLAACDGCAAYLDQLRGVVAAAGRLEPDTLPDATVERLLRAFRAARSG